MKRLLVFLLNISVAFTAFAQGREYKIFQPSSWVDSAMANMTIEEKIGQLFMVAAFSDPKKYNFDDVAELVKDYHIGGVIFFKGTPGKQAIFLNRLNEMSKLPLLVGMDAEWGLAMRLDSTINFGYQMPMGAIDNDSLIYKMGREMGRECKRLGINVSFSPVVDINNNPLNPVINLRSFGENKDAVSRKALAYMRGLQDEHVLAVAKHFPGHGDTETDSHLDLPVLNQSRERLDTMELIPFKYLFSRGVGGVMTAHLQIPSYDTTAHTGASLSPEISTLLLRDKMQFKGLAFSDALNMKGVSKYCAAGEVDLKALMAGNDILLYSEDIPKAFEYIKNAIDSGCIDMEYINSRVRKILETKQWAGLNHCKYVSLDHLYEDLNHPSALLLKEQLAESAITVIKNKDKLLPFKDLSSMKMASVAIGITETPPFQETMNLYNRISDFTIDMNADGPVWKKLSDTLSSFDMIIISLHKLSNKNTATYGLSKKAIDFIDSLNKYKKCVLVSFGSPYALSRFPDFDHVVCAYQDENGFQKAAAEALFGSIQAHGHLPVTICANYPYGAGVVTSPAIRMKYTLPEAVGMSSDDLDKIDLIAESSVRLNAFPGCEILVAKDGKVIYYKAFGDATYNNPNNYVDRQDLYDIASVTKVAATTLSVMKLYEQKKIGLDKTLGYYLPELKGTNKADLTIREIMAHQSGLPADIWFYKKTLNAKGQPDTNYYRKTKDARFSLHVGDSMYLDRSFKDTIYKMMDTVRLNKRGKYDYSDIGFMYIQRVVEKVSHTTLDSFAAANFYRPLGLASMGFKPRERLPKYRLMPTENDTYFRHQLILGYVHDQSAAVLGGVSGNAGLFSNASDLAILMQMLLNGGQYAGVKYFDSSTVHLFTKAAFTGNRRGLGWDKPTARNVNGPTSYLAPAQSFGHTGFTGTCVWADPDNDLVYVFLSNRVYPNTDNHKITDLNVRTEIQDVIYNSLPKKKPVAAKHPQPKNK